MNKPLSIRRPTLLVDAGNTRIKIGLFDADAFEVGLLPECHFVTAARHVVDVPWDDLRDTIGKPFDRLRCCLTGSHPDRVHRLHAAWPDDWPAPIPPIERSTFPLSICVDSPEQVGIDRLLNAVAVNHVRPDGVPAIVVDSGTATTVDYISGAGEFLGGAILPGFDLSARALHGYTALLPLVDKSSLPETPVDDIGRNTEAAIRSGLYWGQIGAVRELLARYQARAQADLAQRREMTQSRQRSSSAITSKSPVPMSPTVDAEPAIVLLTGGAGPLLATPLGGNIRFEANLTLQGLAVIAAKV